MRSQKCRKKLKSKILAGEIGPGVNTKLVTILSIVVNPRLNGSRVSSIAFDSKMKLKINMTGTC